MHNGTTDFPLFKYMFGGKTVQNSKQRNYRAGDHKQGAIHTRIIHRKKSIPEWKSILYIRVRWEGRVTALKMMNQQAILDNVTLTLIKALLCYRLSLAYLYFLPASVALKLTPSPGCFLHECVTTCKHLYQ